MLKLPKWAVDMSPKETLRPVVQAPTPGHRQSLLSMKPFKKRSELKDGAPSHLFPSVVKLFPQGLQFRKPSSALLIKESHDLDHKKFLICQIK